jgi:hypothetical protein
MDELTSRSLSNDESLSAFLPEPLTFEACFFSGGITESIS